MFEQIPLEEDTLFTNPEPRCPVVLVLDNSGSMQGERIKQLNEGLRALEQDLRDDPLAQKRCELAVLTFGNSVQLTTDFTTADAFEPPQLVASGATPMGAAVNRALDLLEARKQQYRQAGLKYYRPWVFLLTDGEPTDAWEDAARRARDGEEQGAFALFAFAVEGASVHKLQQFSAKRPVQRLKGTRFREMFLWLSNSLKSVSRSTPGTAVQLVKPSDEWTI